jgi:hypothetical protein
MDDTSVNIVDEKFMKALYGNPGMTENQVWPTAYMLVYDSVGDE